MSKCGWQDLTWGGSSSFDCIIMSAFNNAFCCFCWQFYDALEDSDRLLASVRDLLGVDPKVCWAGTVSLTGIDGYCVGCLTDENRCYIQSISN